MSRGFMTAIIGAVLLTTHIGCQSDQLVTHAYRLRYPQTETRLINDVLEREHRAHNTPSAAQVTNDGYDIVKTTPRAHAEIEKALRDVRP